MNEGQIGTKKSLYGQMQVKDIILKSAIATQSVMIILLLK